MVRRRDEKEEVKRGEAVLGERMRLPIRFRFRQFFFFWPNKNPAGYSTRTLLDSTEGALSIIGSIYPLSTGYTVLCPVLLLLCLLCLPILMFIGLDHGA